MTIDPFQTAGKSKSVNDLSHTECKCVPLFISVKLRYTSIIVNAIAIFPEAIMKIGDVRIISFVQITNEKKVVVVFGIR